VYQSPTSFELHSSVFILPATCTREIGNIGLVEAQSNQGHPEKSVGVATQTHCKCKVLLLLAIVNTILTSITGLTLQEIQAIERALDRLEMWACMNRMKLN